MGGRVKVKMIDSKGKVHWVAKRPAKKATGGGARPVHIHIHVHGLTGATVHSHAGRAGYDTAGYGRTGYDTAGYQVVGYDTAGYDSARKTPSRPTRKAAKKKSR